MIRRTKYDAWPGMNTDGLTLAEIRKRTRRQRPGPPTEGPPKGRQGGLERDGDAGDTGDRG